MKEDDEKYIEHSRAHKSRIRNNRLLLISLLNAVTLFMFIFAMSYYKWFFLRITYGKDFEMSMWINLLYTYDAEDRYISIKDTIQMRCKQYRQPGYKQICESVLEQMNFVGIFVFSIILVANVLQVYDLSIILYYLIIRKREVIQSDNFRHIFTICTFVLGMGIYLFSTLVINYIPGSYYGVCFYMTFGCILLFILVVVYEQISIRKIKKQDLVDQLLQKYQEERNQKIQRLSSDSFIL